MTREELDADLKTRREKWSAEHSGEKRNLYDIETWGSSCARGIEPKNLGTVVSGAAASRKITTGRKAHEGARY